MRETVLQFGTGNFLRGFFDYFLDELNKKGLYDGGAVVVSPTNSSTVEKINAFDGKYTLLMRGIENGKEKCVTTQIDSICRAINPYMNFGDFLSLAHNPDLRFIVSNTTEAGIAFDESCRFDDTPPASFPGKLTRFLFERYSQNLDGFVIFCCELIDNNATRLKEYVLEYARLWQLGDGFCQWVETKNSFCNTLVDRIVTGFPKDEAEEIFGQIGKKDMLLDTSELYHLWVIEGNYENELPLQKAGFNVIWTNDVTPYKKMKVAILNGAHTSLVFPSLLKGIKSVGESLDDSQMNAFLTCCLFDCILPTLGNTKENEEFALSVIERFKNPYIKHMWTSIALNSVSKYVTRVLPTVREYTKKNGKEPKVLVFSLACLIEYYKTHDVTDNEYAVEFIKSGTVPEILSNKRLWGEDLSGLCDTVVKSLEKLHSLGIEEAIKWSMS